MKIALDVMGGDNAPQSNILGVKRFLNSNQSAKIVLVGDESIIKEQIVFALESLDRLSKHDCSSIIKFFDIENLEKMENVS